MTEHTWPWIYYHPTEGSRIFESAADLRAAGPGWVLTPTEAAAAAAQAAETPASPPADERTTPPRSRR